MHILDWLELRASTSSRIDELWIGALLKESEAAPVLCRVEDDAGMPEWLLQEMLRTVLAMRALRFRLRRLTQGLRYRLRRGAAHDEPSAHRLGCDEGEKALAETLTKIGRARVRC
jgi:hypothetical protein